MYYSHNHNQETDVNDLDQSYNHILANASWLSNSCMMGDSSACNTNFEMYSDWHFVGTQF